MAPDVKQFSRYGSLNNEILEKLKIAEEKEKKKREKETKRRAELEKMKEESLQMQASLALSSKQKSKKQKNMNVEQPKSSNPVMTSNAFKTKDNDIWDESPPDNAWNSYNSNASKTNYSKQSTQSSKQRYNKNSQYENSRQRSYSGNYSSESSNASRRHSRADSLWDDAEEHFPALPAAPVPKVNVWDLRKVKAETVKAMEPQDVNDEEAMLQWAIELSKLEAMEEEEKRRKIEKEYVLQEETLKYNPELLQEIPVLNDNQNDRFEVFSTPCPSVNDDPWLDDDNSKEPTFGPKKDDIYSSKNKTYSTGARPKINKIIDRFGGWGLTDSRQNMKREKLSDFVDNVIEDSREVHYDFKRDKKSDEMSVNDRSKLTAPLLVHVPSKTETTIDTSSGNDGIVYNEKGTFTDLEDDQEIARDAQTDSVHKTSYDNCEFIDELMKDTGTELESQGKFDELENCSITKNSKNVNDEETFESDSEDTNELKLQIQPFNDRDSSKTTDLNSASEHSYFGDIPKDNHHESGGREEYHSSCISSEHDTLNICRKDSGITELEDESNSSLFCDKRIPEKNFAKLEDLWNDKHDPFSVDLDGEENTPPILPPQPASNEPSMSGTENIAFPKSFPSNENVDSFPNLDSSNQNLFPGLPPQFSIPMQQPLFMNPFMCDPTMMTASMNFNPMMGFGMDPTMARQMLMLRNPFLASQLLAMERYYKSMGLPIDVFAMQSQMPNLNPGIAGFLSNQNMPVNAASINPQFMLQPQSQLSSGINPPSVENNASKIDEPSQTRPAPLQGLDVDMSHSNLQPTVESNEPNWFDNMISNEGATAIPPPKSIIPPPKPIIPPPKPMIPPPKPMIPPPKPMIPPPKPAEPQERKSDNMFPAIKPPTSKPDTYKDFPSRQNIPSAVDTTNELSVAVRACITKTEITGWGDLEDEFSEVSHTSNNWGEEDLQVKKSVNRGEGRKPTFRQPASQPQFSRFQRR